MTDSTDLDARRFGLSNRLRILVGGFCHGESETLGNELGRQFGCSHGVRCTSWRAVGTRHQSFRRGDGYGDGFRDRVSSSLHGSNATSFCEQLSQVAFVAGTEDERAEQDIVPRPTPLFGAKSFLQIQTNMHAPREVAIPVQQLRRPRTLGTLQTPRRRRPETPALPQIALTRMLSQQRRMQSDSGWHQLHHDTELQPSSKAGSHPEHV